MEPIKQVIVMRAKYTKENGEIFSIRKGKMIAQGAHAAMSFLTKQVYYGKDIELSDVELEWMMSDFRKICLVVNSEEELLEIHKKALAKGLTSHLVLDNGVTEFKGVKTYTCLAIGPDFASEIDPITKELKLY